MKHNFPLGTPVKSTRINSIVIIDNYRELLYCEEKCTEDHDHFTEPHVNVRVQYWTSVPLSSIETYFDIEGKGHTIDDWTLCDNCMQPANIRTGQCNCHRY